ncbi:C40 family peptidase [Patescibacteria group bacterium]|nr:C40 family peptidase [Patescibacteria group bacterium]MBU1705640.1 C40 family peptidase [Patescibacteria group bacterium]
MDYRAVQVNSSWRCAVNLEELNLPFFPEQVERLLNELGFRCLEIDLLAAARGCVGKSAYALSADPRHAPRTVNCSSFIKYLYSLRGVWLPRYAVQQSELGAPVAIGSKLRLGDLLFSPGFFPLSRDRDGAGGLGHVGLATGEGSVIHASKHQGTVREVPLDAYLGMREGVHSIKRLIPDPDLTLTYLIPTNSFLESSDDVRWLAHTNLRR